MNNTASKETLSGWLSQVINPVHQSLDQLAAFAMALELWRRRQQRSEQFAQIDPRILRDAGISGAQRFFEVNHPFDQESDNPFA